MAETKVRCEDGVFPTDTSTFDVTNAAEVTAGRSPTGVVIIGGHNETIGTRVDDLIYGFGVSDFTDQACVSCTDEDAVGPTDSASSHRETEVFHMHAVGQGSTTLRSASVTAITGGVQLTPIQSGSAYRIQVILVFGSVCKAFSAGNATAQDATFQVAHGMSTAPGAGFYGYNDQNADSRDNARGSFGFHADDGSIKQASLMPWHNNNQAVTTQNATRMVADNVGGYANNNGTLARGVEVTGNDGTNITYTARGGSLSGDLIGLLIECDDISTDMLFVQSPTTAAADWDYTSLAFQPQFVAIWLNAADAAAPNAETTTDAGTYGIFCVDEDGNEFTYNWRSQDGISLGTSNTATNFNTGLRYTGHNGDSALHEMSNFVFTSTGWSVANADIITANGTTRFWPMLAFGQSAAAPVTPTPLSAAGIIVNP